MTNELLDFGCPNNYVVEASRPLATFKEKRRKLDGHMGILESKMKEGEAEPKANLASTTFEGR
jgi:hypothetical protein